MEKVKVLLVGIGGYGENYIKEFLEKDIENAELFGIADPFLFKSPYADKIKEKNIRTSSSPEEFYLKYGKVDLTVISSPIHTHYRYIVSAFENGSNVLVEKPVVISLSLMDDLIKREKESGLFALVGYQMSYQRDLMALKKDVMSGIFGKPLRMKSMRLMRRGSSYYKRNGWAGKLNCHGMNIFDSPLSNACAHQVQTMLYLLSSDAEPSVDVSSVEGFLYKGKPDIENFDAASIIINTAIGVPLYYYTAHSIKEVKIGPISEYEFENATVFDEGGSFKAVFKDGSVKDYSAIDKGDRLQKLYDAIDASRGSEIRPCTLKSTLSHIKTVILTESLPVYLRYDAEKIEENGDVFYAIPGLEKSFKEMYESWNVEKLEFSSLA